MKLLLQFLVIFAFWGLGEGISYLCGGMVPGSLIGMVLLFVALCTKLVKPSWVEQAASYFAKYMVALFVPSAVGIMVVWDLLSAHLVPILIVVSLSAILTMVVVALMFQKLNNR